MNTYDGRRPEPPYPTTDEVASASPPATAPNVLEEIKAAILSPLNQHSIVDTVWVGPAQTLVDYIDARLAEGPATAAPYTDRFMDEIDAASAAEKWLEGVADRRRLRSAFTEKTWHYHKNDGGTVALWHKDELIAQATILRDDANYSVLTCFEVAPPATAAEIEQPTSEDVAWGEAEARKIIEAGLHGPDCIAPPATAAESYEPNGGNIYRPHRVMADPGTFWRCAHGLTTLSEEFRAKGCPACAAEDPTAVHAFHGEPATAAESVTLREAITEEMVRDALQEAWDDFCGDANAHPSCFEILPRKHLRADFRRAESAFLYHIAAALNAALTAAGQAAPMRCTICGATTAEEVGRMCTYGGEYCPSAFEPVSAAGQAATPSEPADADLLDLIEKHRLSVSPQCNGGWVIEGSSANGEMGDADEVEHARTRGSLREALKMARKAVTPPFSMLDAGPSSQGAPGDE